MNGEKALAACFILVLLSFFLYEKHALQREAANSIHSKSKEPWFMVKARKEFEKAAKLTRDYEALMLDRKARSLHHQAMKSLNQSLEKQRTSSERRITVAPPFTRKAAVDRIPRRGSWFAASNLSHKPTDSRVLNLNDAAAFVDSSCPLPLLHPEKFQPIMKWGIRKSFKPCRPTGEEKPFSRLDPTETKLLIDDEHCKAPSGTTTVYVFDELKDTHFNRMESTLDAETRQNELKEMFSNVDTFASLARAENNGAEFRLDGKPYAFAKCGGRTELHVSAPRIRPRQHKPSQGSSYVEGKSIRNVIHLMWDSTSIYAQRRGAKKVVKWLEELNNGVDSPSYVFPMKHYHAVSCCSPGNQIPVYSGNLNGEGDPFVRAEPFPTSKDWLWNIARDELGFKTFWSLDNCPDKSARDYHAYPTVDSRVVAPLCMAGVLLSHRDSTCLGGKTVDEHVTTGLQSFFAQHAAERKFAAVQYITPHEETEKLLIELDLTMIDYFKLLQRSGQLNDTAIIFWSDHGINFGKYASTHDGELEKMFPFVHFILPRWFAPEMHANLRDAMNKLVTPYDIYEVARSILYYPAVPPAFAKTRDKKNPPLPLPSQSHIIASFQKKLTPVDLSRFTLPANRSCLDANIPQEFCTCIAYLPEDPKTSKFKRFIQLAVAEHKRLLANHSEKCHPVVFEGVDRLEVQTWPMEYHPKEQSRAKSIWMKPNRDMVRIKYHTSGAGKGIFVAAFSVDKKEPEKKFDVARIDRLDAMKSKCGIVNKVEEQLCVCK